MEKVKQTKALSPSLELKFIVVPYGAVLRNFFSQCLIQCLSWFSSLFPTFTSQVPSLFIRPTLPHTHKSTFMIFFFHCGRLWFFKRGSLALTWIYHLQFLETLDFLPLSFLSERASASESSSWSSGKTCFQLSTVLSEYLQGPFLSFFSWNYPKKTYFWTHVCWQIQGDHYCWWKKITLFHHKVDEWPLSPFVRTMNTGKRKWTPEAETHVTVDLSAQTYNTLLILQIFI